MPPDRKQLVVLYAEANLQKSIDLPGSFTVAKAKEEGMTAIRDHLKRVLPGVAPITLDPDCTDFYPVTKDDTVIRSLKGNPTMVVYPEPPKGQTLTPSPLVDALQSAVHDVRSLKAQQSAASLIKEESTKNNVKPSYSENSSDKDGLLRRFEAMEAKFGNEIAELKQSNAELKQGNAELKQDNAELKRYNAELKQDNAELKRYNAELTRYNAELKRDNAELKWDNAELRRDNAELMQNNAELRRENVELKHEIAQLKDQMNETTRAVLGDRIAIDKIRQRVLLDMGRDQLAMMCGHNDWKQWKAASTAGEDFAVKNAMMREAEMMLQNSKDVSEYWKAVGQNNSTLQLLTHRNRIRARADIAAHASTKKAIAESVLALTSEGDRDGMITIYRAVYNSEP